MYNNLMNYDMITSRQCLSFIQSLITMSRLMLKIVTRPVCIVSLLSSICVMVLSLCSFIVELLNCLHLLVQILCLGEQIRFTENCEEALKRGGLRSFLAEIENQLESYTSVDFAGAGKEGEAHVLELKLKALILDTIHAIDVVHFLMNNGIKSTADWQWQKQLR